MRYSVLYAFPFTHEGSTINGSFSAADLAMTCKICSRHPMKSLHSRMRSCPGVEHSHSMNCWDKGAVIYLGILRFKGTSTLRVPPGVDFDVLRQSHCPLINREPVCVRPPKPYMALFYLFLSLSGGADS